jgi:hypothetical protein
MIASPPPKIFSKEVAQNKATPLIAPATFLTTRNRFTPNFRGWGLDENLKLKSPPTGGQARRNKPGTTRRCCAACGREESPCQLGAVHTWHLMTFRER